MWPKPQRGGQTPRGHPPGRGGGLGHLGAIFCSWVLLDFFGVLLLIFFNFLSISNGFWEDLGRVLVDFGKV